MCGLIGCVRVRGSLLDDEAPDPEEMLARIAHRGPDDSGWVERDSAILGHTRLAIQDAYDARSAQPFTSGPITLTYNGELWNGEHIEIGPRRTKGDTEVVARVIEEHGVDGLSLLDGMWALAWHDSRDGLIRLARDPLGKIPLYWRETPDGIEWASEYGALSRGPGATPVLPGEVVTIDPLTAQSRRESPEQPADEIGWDPSPDSVRALLRYGVMERLVGDRPIAFMLSGGLDSSLILALAREHYEGQIVAYTAVLDPGSRDLDAAAYVAAHLDIELVHVPVPEVTHERIAEAVRVVEIPMKAQVEIALAHLPVIEAMASDGFAVCLSGEAADELFGGYGNMQIQARDADDEGYRAIKSAAVAKMARGNFARVNKVGMRYGVECRLPFMQTQLVELALSASKEASPPGKKLLKAAAKGIVPDRIISRPKETFQGATGTAYAAAEVLVGSPTIHYNQLARQTFGHLPRA